VANPSKRKGSAFEKAVAEWLTENGFPYAERRVLQGSADRGDIAGIPGLVLECKNTREMKLSQWMDELRAEKANARVDTAAVVISRRNHSVGKSYVVMEFDDFLHLIV
jgi:Holliday junction resolvase